MRSECIPFGCIKFHRAICLKKIKNEIVSNLDEGKIALLKALLGEVEAGEEIGIGHSGAARQLGNELMCSDRVSESG